MHSNKKMITFAVMVSLLIATLFLIPQTANVNANASTYRTAKHVKKTHKHKKVRHYKKTSKRHAKRIVSVTPIKKHSTYKVRKHLSGSNAAAKNWIANHESGGSYTAKNGSCYGKYQLLISYYNGNLSHKNQELTANNYVKATYGSWVKAKKFWLRHHWY